MSRWAADVDADSDSDSDFDSDSGSGSGSGSGSASDGGASYIKHVSDELSHFFFPRTSFNSSACFCSCASLKARCCSSSTAKDLITACLNCSLCGEYAVVCTAF